VGSKRTPGRHAAPHQFPLPTRTVAMAAGASVAAGAIIIASHASPPGPTHLSIANAATHSNVRANAYTPADAPASTTVRAPHIGTYRVKSGDTLSSITQELFGNANLWPRLYDANERVVGTDPNTIYPGEEITEVLGKHAAYGATLTAVSDYKPRHASQAHATSAVAAGGTPSYTGGEYLSCRGLEGLWDSVGGNPADAEMAAAVAMAESGGYEYAYNPDDDKGFWQINWTWGALSTFNPTGNAEAAVKISDDGTDWNPWVTYQKGMEYGNCGI
jgi:LysM repeat protein